MTLFQLSYLALWILALVLVPVSVALLFMLGQLREQAGPGYRHHLLGRKMPAFSAKDSSGTERRIDEFLDKSRVVLVVSSGCDSCRKLLDDLALRPEEDLEAIGLILVCVGDFRSCSRALSGIHAIAALSLDPRDKNDETIDIILAGYPAALLLSDAGVIVDVRHPLSSKGLLAALERVEASAAPIVGMAT